jgi:hypothetical protein
MMKEASRPPPPPRIRASTSPRCRGRARPPPPPPESTRTTPKETPATPPARRPRLCTRLSCRMLTCPRYVAPLCCDAGMRGDSADVVIGTARAVQQVWKGRLLDGGIRGSPQCTVHSSVISPKACGKFISIKVNFFFFLLLPFETRRQFFYFYFGGME